MSEPGASLRRTRADGLQLGQAGQEEAPDSFGGTAMTDIVVDVAWPIRQPGWIPLEHGYYLLSAVSGLIPRVHEDRQMGIHRIRGTPSSPGRLRLTSVSALT